MRSLAVPCLLVCAACVAPAAPWTVADVEAVVVSDGQVLLRRVQPCARGEPVEVVVSSAGRVPVDAEVEHGMGGAHVRGFRSAALRGRTRLAWTLDADEPIVHWELDLAEVARPLPVFTTIVADIVSIAVPEPSVATGSGADPAPPGRWTTRQVNAHVSVRFRVRPRW